MVNKSRVDFRCRHSQRKWRYLEYQWRIRPGRNAYRYRYQEDAISNVVLNTLLKHTASIFFRSKITRRFGSRTSEITQSEDIIRYFVEHRHDVVVRRTQFNWESGRTGTYPEGLIIASDHIDEVIRLIGLQNASGRSDCLDGCVQSDRQTSSSNRRAVVWGNWQGWNKIKLGRMLKISWKTDRSFERRSGPCRTENRDY